ncbi:MAG: hypothetical protein AB7U73_08565 [Pirellulales bacterium]
MSQSELLKRAAKTLDRLGLEYMLTGSLATSLQGAPRATHDIDLVVELPANRIDDLAAEFPAPQFYLDTHAMREAVTRRTMFNLLDTAEGDKVDFWLLTDDAFDRSRFARRQHVPFDDASIAVSTPEDSILMKLRWVNLSGGSEKHFGDALRVFQLLQPVLDLVYLDEWAHALNVAALWQRLRDEATTEG